MPGIQKPLDMAKNFISDVISKGDTAVDATAGNGNDTLFLSRIVGEEGKVYAFDIQEKAIRKTSWLLGNENVKERVKLFSCGHEEIVRYLEEEISAAMFNLGYLPGGDHSIITKPETTLKAVENVLEYLLPGGIVTIVMYSGHEGGKEEKGALLHYCQSLSQLKFTTLLYEIINQVNQPPSLLVIEKLRN